MNSIASMKYAAPKMYTRTPGTATIMAAIHVRTDPAYMTSAIACRTTYAISHAAVTYRHMTVDVSNVVRMQFYLV